MSHVRFVYFGERFHHQTGGEWGSLVADDPVPQRVEWEDVFEALCAGKEITIRPADTGELAIAEEYLASYKEVKRLEALESTADHENQ